MHGSTGQWMHPAHSTGWLEMAALGCGTGRADGVIGKEGRICAQHRESAKCIIPNSSILSVGSGMLESSVRSK